MEEILREVFHAETHYTTRVSESVLARLHYVARVPDGEHVPDAVATSSRAGWATRRARGPTTSPSRRGPDARGGGGRPAADDVWRAFPEAYKEDFPARVGGGRPAPGDAVTEARRPMRRRRTRGG